MGKNKTFKIREGNKAEEHKRKVGRMQKAGRKQTKTSSEEGRVDYKKEVLSRLQENFQLDDAVAHYRGLYSGEYKINPNDFTLDRFVSTNLDTRQEI